MDRLHIIEGFLSKEECSLLLEKYKSELELRPATVAGMEISDKRKSSVAFVNNIEQVDERLKNVLKDLIKLKGYQVTGLVPYQFTEYKVGEYYDWHTDSSREEGYKDRYCSIVIQLNDGYDGGYLQIKDASGDNSIQIDHGIGNLIIFYSNLKHRVMPVTRGVRYSLVNWVSLKEVDGFKKTLM